VSAARLMEANEARSSSRKETLVLAEGLALSISFMAVSNFARERAAR
jgi:hypothetical protein